MQNSIGLGKELEVFPQLSRTLLTNKCVQLSVLIGSTTLQQQATHVRASYIKTKATLLLRQSVCTSHLSHNMLADILPTKNGSVIFMMV